MSPSPLAAARCFHHAYLLPCALPGAAQPLLALAFAIQTGSCLVHQQPQCTPSCSGQGARGCEVVKRGRRLWPQVQCMHGRLHASPAGHGEDTRAGHSQTRAPTMRWETLPSTMRGVGVAVFRGRRRGWRVPVSRSERSRSATSLPTPSATGTGPTVHSTSTARAPRHSRVVIVPHPAKDCRTSDTTGELTISRFTRDDPDGHDSGTCTHAHHAPSKHECPHTNTQTPGSLGLLPNRRLQPLG